MTQGKAMKRKSKFRAWFVEQFGRAPSEATRARLAKEAKALRGSLEHTESLLHAEIALLDAYGHALYGWNAKGKEKP